MQNISEPAWIYIVRVCSGLLFGLAPFAGRFRTLPQWIRIALLMSGLCFFSGRVAAAALRLFADRISQTINYFLFSQIVLVVGAGIGITLLLIISGEIFKALAALDTARKQEHDARASNHCK